MDEFRSAGLEDFGGPPKSTAEETNKAVSPSTPERAAVGVEGAVDSLTRSGASGWAWLPANPDLALHVIALLDGRVITVLYQGSVFRSQKIQN